MLKGISSSRELSQWPVDTGTWLPSERGDTGTHTHADAFPGNDSGGHAAAGAGEQGVSLGSSWQERAAPLPGPGAEPVGRAGRSRLEGPRTRPLGVPGPRARSPGLRAACGEKWEGPGRRGDASLAGEAESPPNSAPLCEEQSAAPAGRRWVSLGSRCLSRTQAGRTPARPARLGPAPGASGSTELTPLGRKTTLLHDRI